MTVVLATGLLWGGQAPASEKRAVDPLAIDGLALCNAERIRRLEFSGNRVTRDVILRRALADVAGKPCTPEALQDAINALWNLELFRDVSLSVNPVDAVALSPAISNPVATSAVQVVPDATAADGASENSGLLFERAVDLEFSVREKIYFLPVPRFSRTSDGELRYGAQLRWDNLFGLQHELRLTAEKREPDSGEGREGQIAELDYRVPRFLGTDHGLSLTLGEQSYRTELSVDGQAIGLADRRSAVFGLRLSRWLDGGSWVDNTRLTYGVAFEDRRYTLQSGTLGPFTSGQNLILSLGLDRNEVVSERFRRHGRRLGLRVSLADEALGSDWSYRRVDVYGRWYRPVPGPIANLNIQARMSFSDGSPFGFPLHTLGGGDELRGMPGGQEEGNQLLLVNVEYLRAFNRAPNWRWLAFADIGNTWQLNLEGLDDLALRLGAGLRWKVQVLSRTDVRLDIAWDPENERLRPYFSTSLTF